MMSLLHQIHSILIFLLLAFYEVSCMHPEARLIDFSPLLMFTLFSLLFVYTLYGRIPKDPCSVIFVILEILIVFFTVEHSLFHALITRNVYFSISFPLFFYFFSYNYTMQKGDRTVPLLAFFLVLVFFIVYIVNRSDGFELMKSDSGAYVILYYMPFLLCLKKRFLKAFSLILCMIAVFLAFKRGGIICFFCGLFSYLFVSVFFAHNYEQKTKKIIGAMLLFFVVAGTLIYVDNFFDGYISHRFTIIEETGGNGRDEVLVHTFGLIKESSFSGLLVGHGNNAVLQNSYLSLSAHNDFLECLYDYGIVTFFAYVLLYIFFIVLAIRLVKLNTNLAASLLASIVMFFVNSLVSHILLYDWHFVTFALFWGYAVACAEKEFSSRKLVSQSF